MHSNHLVKRLAILFGEPKTDEPAAFIAEYANAFRGISKDVLDTAADLIIRQRKFRAWPTVAECLDAIDSAKRHHVKDGVKIAPIEHFDEWWADKVKRVSEAETVEAITEALNEVRQYHCIGWIASWRLPYLVDIGMSRRGELSGGNVFDLTSLSKRIVGDGDAA